MAEDDAVFADEGVATVIDVLENDAPIDGATLQVEAIVEPPTHGRAEILPDGRVRYEPDEGFTGTDGFRYRAGDDEGRTAEADVTVTVQPAGDLTEACPPGEVPAADHGVGADNAHRDAIDCVYWWRIAQGQGPGDYDPGGPVRRDQMASFVARLIREAGGELPGGDAAPFADRCPAAHQANVAALHAAGLIEGYASGVYGCADPVTRQQLAAFLVRTLEHLDGEALPAPADHFADVSGAHALAVGKAREAGLTIGDDAGRFRPLEAVRRDQTASFLVRLLDRLIEDGIASPPG